MNLREYLSSDATRLAGLVTAKEVTASELLALARERQDAVNPALNAVVLLLPRVADARAADPTLSGPFAGAPVRRSQPASCPPPGRTTAAARSGSPRPAPAWSA